jgi:hypothetical protein
MDTTTHGKNGTTKNNLEELDQEVEHVETAIKHRVEMVGDVASDIRDKVEMVLHERPYLLPAAAGALGLGVGVLIGSKLSRMLVLGAAGAMLSDTVRAQALKIGKELLHDLSESLEDSEDIEEPTTSTV